MTDLEKFQLVNSCETANALSVAILSFADDYGIIQGRMRGFNASKMADNVQYVVNGDLQANVLTREFGIRQQALYIAYYNALGIKLW